MILRGRQRSMSHMIAVIGMQLHPPAAIHPIYLNCILIRLYLSCIAASG